jgi:hypothetical protein
MKAIKAMAMANGAVGVDQSTPFQPSRGTKNDLVRWF